MGFGKKKEDAAVVLGYLKAMPWEREPLTEVQPFENTVALDSSSEGRDTVQSIGIQAQQ